MRASFFIGLWLAVELACTLSPALAQSPAVAAGEAAAAPIALLIANGSYPASGTPLRLPERNASLLADELRRAGFSVDIHENLGKAAMGKVIGAFADRIAPGKAALFFFSGYSIQARGATYLIPVDADIWTEADVRTQGIGIETVAAAMDKARARTKLIVLDAARRNPFERRFRSLSAGIAPVALPPGSLLIASADVGRVSDEDAGSDASLFIGELLKEMRATGLTADEVFHRTRIGVARATNGAQRPYVVSSLGSDYYFNPPLSERGSPQDGEGRATHSSLAQEREPVIGLPPGDVAPGTVFRDCSECPQLVMVPAGEFNMGSEDFDSEKPVHLVRVAGPFAVGRTEVTFAQWEACAADGGCSFTPAAHGEDRSALPVSGVSWSDAKAYADWLTRKLGHRYRLLSEAEWEYVARAGTVTPFWWGTEAQAGFANCRGCGGSGGRRALPAGSYPANPFGLHDTAGNVAEWVEDCWTGSYDDAPADAGAKAAEPCKQRVLRGGSFDAGPRYARSASRFLYDAELRYYANGFRVLRELP